MESGSVELQICSGCGREDREILIDLARGTDSKSALIAALMLLSCKKETAEGAGETLTDRFGADTLFVHCCSTIPG